MKRMLCFLISAALCLTSAPSWAVAPGSSTEINNYCLEKWDGDLSKLWDENYKDLPTDRSCEQEQETALGKFKVLISTRDHNIFESCLKLRPEYTKVLECSLQKLEALGGDGPSPEEHKKRFKKKTRFQYLYSKPQYAGEEGGIPYSYNFKNELAYGTIGDWLIQCKKDLFTDKTNCSLSNPNGAFLIVFGEDFNSPRICIGLKNYPDSKIQIRVDRNPHHSAEAKTCFSGKAISILEEIRKGDAILTRYERWPSKQWVENEIKTTGFPLALELSQWLYNQ